MTASNRVPVVTVVLVIVANTWWIPIVWAQSAADNANALAHQLMSPYCPGLLLADCRSEGARELRAEILQRLTSGEKADAIKSDLVMRFGAVIRTEPAFEGIGLVAWTGPLVFGFAGVGIVVWALRRRDCQANTMEPADIEQEPRMNARLQDELDALD